MADEAASCSTVSADNSVVTLSVLFEKGLQLHEQIQDSSVSVNSKESQEIVQNIISNLEKATLMVNELSLFSINEDFEEIPTADIKYLLLPALLGSLVCKITNRDRSEILNAGEVYFKDFLLRLKSYGVTTVKIPEPPGGDVVCPSNEVIARRPQAPMSVEALQAMAMERKNKIERFMRQKELKQREAELRKRIEAEEFDEETTRDYYRTLIDCWIITALEELESIQKEKPIVEYMANLKATGKDAKLPDKQIRKPFKPITIVRNEFQKKVIGVGYPSRPVLTVDEFYAQRYPEHSNKTAAENEAFALSMQSMAEDPDRTKKEIEKETAEKEDLEDKEDKVYYIRERNWDDWKDDHRRGWGNRQNMG